MNAIFSKLLYEMQEGRDTMLVTVVSEAGSAPRGTGARMLVGQEGRLLGTIGGGPAEFHATNLARELLRERRSVRHDYALDEQGEVGAVCGGSISVLFQYVPAGAEMWRAAAQAVLERLERHESGYFVQRLDGGDPALLDGEGNVLLGAAADGAPCPGGCVLTETAFIQALPVGERAVIFGAGHCSAALVPILRTVGFRPVVIDDRAEYAVPERFPAAEAVICGDYADVDAYVTLTPEDYAVVMTNGHKNDLAVEAQLLRRELAYVGVIGSRRKTAFVNGRLREMGIEEAKIASVHTPIGTPIRAVTPEEIAVSIAGEMICERAMRREADGAVHHGCPMH